MGLGFVIDHRRCIGCHACTVACKSENEVPIGSFRTWVKYVEKGAFPAVRRHFTVLRCNHCDAAPCVEICPVVALHKRPDAIVDLDRDLCIGCRACMQACPYDALYLNEDTGTAEKCHFCAHRTELGLEPACVVVCPEQAIVAGDVDRPDTRAGRLIREEPVRRRREEKGTEPRVWYVDALDEALEPGLPAERPHYLWSDRSTPPPPVPRGFEPPADLVSTLDVGHPPAWGWHIWVYLLTKNIAAGAMLAAPLDGGAWGPPGEARVGHAAAIPELVALAGLAITGFLLVHDLGRPDRFLKILFHPNPRSWLVKGTWVLAGFGLVTGASLVAGWSGASGLQAALRFLAPPFAVLAAGYTAWLFRQCKGRGLWQEPGLFAHLVAQAALCGAGVAMLLPGARERGPFGPAAAFALLAAANAVWLRLLAARRPREEDAARAHALLQESGAPRRAVLALYLAALAALAPGIGVPWSGVAVAAVQVLAISLAAFALLDYERAFVDAAQRVPNS